MAVEIKSGNSTDVASVDAISKAIRVTNYDSNGVEIIQSLPIAIAVNPVTVVNNDLIGSFDVSAYKFVSLQLTGSWVGTVSFQGSNDNGTFDSIVSQDIGVIDAPYVPDMSTNGMLKIPISYKYMRVRVTAFTSGTVEGTAFGYKEDSNTGQISSTGEVTVADDQSINIGAINGQTITYGAGNSDAGTQRVVIASDAPFPIEIQAGTEYIGNVVVIADPNAPAYQTDFYVTGVGAVDVNSRMIRTGACSLISVVMTSYAATPRHIKLYDTATTPVAGVSIPVLVLTRSSSGNNSYPLPAGGFPFTNGIGMTFVQGAANDNSTGTATVDASITAIFT